MAAQPLRSVEREVPTTATQLRTVPTQSVSTDVSPAVRQAYGVLKFGFTAAPIIAGADKFFHVLVNWDQYLAPIVPRVLGIHGHTFMLGVGVVEIVAGIGVALKPKIFGYVVSAWLGGIVINLLMTGDYYDIALRDFGLALGAFALGKLSGVFDRRRNATA